MVLLGSNGRTFQEVATVMGLATGVDVQNNSQRVHEQFGRLIKKLQESTGNFNIDKQVNFASAIFVQEGYPIRQMYKKTAESLYSSEVLNVNFANNPHSAQQIVNAWVSERTKGKIPSILNETPSSATKVILASAMYFKAQWEKPFFEGTTKKRPFYPNGRHTKEEILVEMMSNGGVFPYFKDTALNCEIIGLPYKGNQTTMYVVIPNDSNSAKLKELELRLTYTEIRRLVSNVKYTRVIILFPKMRIDSTIDLKESLKLLGVKSLFNPVESNLALLSPGVTQNTHSVTGEALQNPLSISNADEKDIIIFTRNGEPVNCTQIFDPKSDIDICETIVNSSVSQDKISYKKFGNKLGRKIERTILPRLSEDLDSIRHYINQQNNPDKFENPGLFADNVIHKVYMDITESGTEAAAATSTSLSRDGGRVSVRVDVPFFFFIMHEETETMLFWGSVTAPTPSFN